MEMQCDYHEVDYQEHSVGEESGLIARASFKDMLIRSKRMVVPELDTFPNLKNRNLFTFQGTSWSACETVKSSYSWAKQYASLHKDGPHERQEAMLAVSLSNGWIRLNTDGAVKVNSRLAAAEGVLRDQNGEWILGYNRCLGEQWILQHVPKEDNNYADYLAKMAFGREEGLQLYEPKARSLEPQHSNLAPPHASNDAPASIDTLVQEEKHLHQCPCAA
ncbi:hypothetical protein Gotur_019321 [Gossypium turneri]